VAQRDHDGKYIANLGDDQFTGIREAVSITDMEYFAMTFRIADGGDVFRARRTCGAGCAGFGGFALGLHRQSRLAGQMQGILDKASYRTNIAKVIRAMRLEKQWLPKPRFYKVHANDMFCKEM